MRREGFLSNRLFDAVASGARVISDDVDGLHDLFGSSVQVAEDASALQRLVSSDSLDRVFGDVEQRRSVARRVHREHSFAHRAGRLLELALEVRKEQVPERRG
jgi:spore maturation protein CgeB